MRVSKIPVNSHLWAQVFNLFGQAVADLKSQEEVDKFFKAFLSEAEYITMIKRVGVAYFLAQKKSYREIKQNLKVSSATISIIQNTLSNPSIQKTVQKMKAEEWAGELSNKIKGLMTFSPRLKRGVSPLKENDISESKL